SGVQACPDLRVGGRQDAEDAVVARETIELAFLAAIQHLPPRQRAVLILRDALDWSANETAAVLEMSVAAVNSALQRARATMKKRLPAARLEWAAATDAEDAERSLLQTYKAAWERHDASQLVALLRKDVRLAMPPHPTWYEGGGRRVPHRRGVPAGVGTAPLRAHPREQAAGVRRLPGRPRRRQTVRGPPSRGQVRPGRGHALLPLPRALPGLR